MTIIKGLSPLNTGAENRIILQEAIDQVGEIRFDEAGVYRIAGTVFIGDHTHQIRTGCVFRERIRRS